MSRARPRAAVAVLLLASLTALASGCWNAIPLDHRALIQIITVDPAPHGKVRWTFFEASPTALASMGSGSGGSENPGGGTTADQVIPLSVEAKSLADAYRLGQDLSSRDLYLGQVQAIVLSGRLAPAAVSAALDGLAHTPELDQSQALFAAADGAKAAILAPDPQELFPSAYLDHVASCPTCSTVAFHLSLMDAFLATRTAWGSMVMPALHQSSVGLAVRGAVVYAGPRRVAQLAPDDATLIGLLTGNTVKTSVTLDVPGLGSASVRSLAAQARIRPLWRHGRLAARVQVRLVGELVGLEPDRGERFEAVRSRVEEALAKTVLERTARVLAGLTRAGADPLALGERLFAADPSAAPSAAVWQRALRHAAIRLDITASLASQGAVR